jgi:L,D-peptidoglycan transpeptidase YkuD (ErfK/YbiS/YcfS/YnhG family)
MNLLVSGDGEALWGARRFRCALGRGGLSRAKREGDGATPLGSWAMRRLLYRADRLALPRTGLAVEAIAADDGWCDDPAAPQYNRPIRFPLTASGERLWREDGLYDLIVPLGYNDDPVQPGAGSAIFVHVARPDYGPTEGCVAFAAADLLAILRDAGPGSRVIVSAAGGQRL